MTMPRRGAARQFHEHHGTSRRAGATEGCDVPAFSPQGNPIPAAEHGPDIAALGIVVAGRADLVADDASRVADPAAAKTHVVAIADDLAPRWRILLDHDLVRGRTGTQTDVVAIAG